MKRRNLIVLGLTILLLTASGLIYSYIQQKNYETWYNLERVRPLVKVEVGMKSLDIGLFLTSSEYTGAFLDAPAIDLSKVGKYNLKITSGPKVYQTSLVVEDLTPPILELKDIVSPINATLRPEDFVHQSKDVTKLSYRFASEPDMSKPGAYRVEIIATDEGKNETRASAKLKLVSFIDKIVREIDETKPLTKKDFFLGEELLDAQFVTNPEDIDLKKLGRTVVNISYNGDIVEIPVEIVDTKKPVVVLRNVQIYAKSSLKAESFLVSVSDATDVKAFFTAKPDLLTIGPQTVNLLFEDEAGNQTKASAILTLIKDPSGPVIRGAKDIRVTSAGSVNFTAGVSASDNSDGSVKVSVDSSKVNTNQEGSYPLTYSAQDSDGNKTVKTVTVYVDFITPYAPVASTGSATLDNLCDGILSKLLNNDMSRSTKISKIFYWAVSNIRYAGSNDTALIPSAIDGLLTRSGNCYTRANVLRALFMRVGVSSSLGQEYRGLHAWAQIGNYVYDSGFNRFAVPLSSLQNFVFKNVYMYRTTAYTPTNTEGYRNEVRSSTIPFVIQKKENPLVPLGEVIILQPGKDGVKYVEVQIRVSDGRETQLRQWFDPEMIPQIEEVGTGVVTYEEKTIIEKLPFTVKITLDPSKPEGYQEIVKPGVDGSKTTVYRLYLLNGKEIAERTQIISENTVAPVQREIIQGTMPPVSPAN